MAVQKLQRCENSDLAVKWCSYWRRDPIALNRVCKAARSKLYKAAEFAKPLCAHCNVARWQPLLEID